MISFDLFDFSDLLYLMCCTIDNHLSEGAIFQNSTVKPSESSLVLLKRDKIKLNAFPSDLNQLITDIRTQLPLCIHYRTTDSVRQIKDYILSELKTKFETEIAFLRSAHF
ncbi:unnamed protein product [Rotaria socialis]|uniref:Uncharacterized protein n=1 Tax=Rotaria socialis TaxID=392032 RepID=A0A821M7E9_9BILA|nr:unnamed protein product [Rotaria socialis]